MANPFTEKIPWGEAAEHTVFGPFSRGVCATRMESAARRRLQQANVGELLSSLDAEWSAEQRQVQAQISLLHGQVEELRHELPAASAPHSRADHDASIHLLGAELRLEELSSRAAQRASDEQRVALRKARTEGRSSAETRLREQAAALEASALIAELEQEVAKQERRARVVDRELRGARAQGDGSGGDGGEVDDWTQAIDDAGRAYYWNTRTQETSWNTPVALARGGPSSSDEEPAEAVTGETVQLRGRCEKLEQQLVSVSKRLRAAGAALSEQQLLVREAMSVGSSRVLGAVMDAWVMHQMRSSLRQWADASAAMAGKSQVSLRVEYIFTYSCGATTRI